MSVVPAAFTERRPDALRCLFTEPTPTWDTLLANLRAGWPADQAPALLAELLDSGCITRAPSDRTRYRLASDVLAVDWVKLSAPVPDAGPRFSLFRGGITSVKPAGDTTPAALWADLTSSRLRVRIERLRAARRGGTEYARLKSGLDYVTPGGTFAQRSERGLVAASGLLVLDFDHLPDLSAARAALLADPVLGPAVALLFTSPSGDGLKCLLPTDRRLTHEANFKGFARYLTARYAGLGLVPDKSGKDVSRACFLAYDPDAYLSKRFSHPFKLAA